MSKLCFHAISLKKSLLNPKDQNVYPVIVYFLLNLTVAYHYEDALVKKKVQSVRLFIVNIDFSHSDQIFQFRLKL